PHQVRLAEVDEPEPPPGEPPPAQAVDRSTRKLAMRTAGIARKRRLVVGDCIVPPGPGLTAGDIAVAEAPGTSSVGLRLALAWRGPRKLSAVPTGRHGRVFRRTAWQEHPAGHGVAGRREICRIVSSCVASASSDTPVKLGANSG